MVLAGLVVLLTLAGLAFAARAAAGEVHFDPESPAGKEYALPLQQARNEALGGGSPESAGAAEAAPLFGVGIGAHQSSAASGPEGDAKSHGNDGHHGKPAHQPPATSRPTAHPGRESPAAGNTRSEDAQKSYSAGLGILIVGALLLVGAAIGVGLRFRGRALPTG